MLINLPIDKIVRRPDVRALNENTVSALADSISTVGLINPIRVRERLDGWEVSAGSHRLAACEKLGLTDIECIVVSDDDLHAELSMIDENLCRNELSPAERASQTARRKAIYEELHQEAKAGAVSANARWHADEKFAPAFTTDTAKATGQSTRTVQLNAERGTKVIAEVIDMITGTKLDSGTYLDKLKRLSPNDQVAAARRDLAIQRQQQKPVKRSPDPQDDVEVRERQVSALMSAWNKASAEAREEFLARIDTPVFGRTAGAA